MYELNVSQDGTVNSREPVNAYWTRHNTPEQRRLGWLEKKLAYGVNYLDGYMDEFYIAALPEQIVELDEENGCLMAYTVINGKRALLENIYVDVIGSGISTVVKSITLTGTALSTGEKITEKINN
jgi:hypothetical protein